MSLIKDYLKDRLKPVVGYGLTILVFVVVGSLYQLDNLPKVMYAAVITGFIGGCYGIYDFWQYRRHYQVLHELAARSEAEGEAEADGKVGTGGNGTGRKEEADGKSQARENEVANERMEFALGRLPEPSDALQAEYQKRLREMAAAFRQDQSVKRRKETEMMDYYLMWAHQIKTPIAAMKLLIQNGQTGGFLMERELFKIESYVEMVLYYLRLESISADMLLKKYDLSTMVKHAIKKYSLLFIDKKITMDLQEMNREIITDEKWFSFVLEQLLSNAVKYTSQGKVSIYLENDRLVIADTGIGIREEDLPRIFERGFTGYNGRMDKKSTGIGLYLSKQVTDRLGISLTVTARPGKGTKAMLNLTQSY